jgi:hypothetical protein
MKILHLLLLLLACVVSSSCQSSFKLLKPKQETGFSLSNYPTYGFYEIDTEGDSSSKNFEKNIQLIKENISVNLSKKGLNEVQDPALKINIAFSVTEGTQTRQTNFLNDGYPRYMGQRRYTWKSEEVPVGKYRKGVVLLDFVDTENNKMVWRGGAKGILPNKQTKMSDTIEEAIIAIISKLP